MESPYEILGVGPDASEADIERAYRQRVKETHPDQGGSVTEFLRVRRAYEELVDGHTVGGDPAGGAGPNAGSADRQPGRDQGRDRRRSDDRGATGRRRDGRRASGRRRNGHRANGRRSGAQTGDDSAGADADESDLTHVEYLDYDVLVDRDWDLTDEDLFERAADADLDSGDYGTFTVAADETLLAAAERHGHDWPYSCRGGACANCAVAVLAGELSVPVNHILPDEMIERDVRLSCIGEPVSEELRVVFNVKHLPELDELRLPPHPSS